LISNPHRYYGQNFEIDEESEEYLELHPQAATKEPRLTEEHFL
jgi:ribosome biogenesis protein ENP2